MRHSIAAPRQAMSSCGTAGRARRDLDLQAHQVEPGHQFGDRVLHLQARVHFQEVEAAVGIHQEFHRAGVVVARGARGADRRLSHLVAHFGMLRDQRRRALLDHLLMAPLDRALALAQVDHVAVAVAQHLDLDVAGALDQAFDVDFGAAEGALGLATTRREARLPDLPRGPPGACLCRRRLRPLSAGSGSRSSRRTSRSDSSVTGRDRCRG